GGLDVEYAGLYYCESHPEAYGECQHIDCFIWKLATMLTQEYFRNPLNCPINSGNTTDKELIYQKSISVPISQHDLLLTIIPSCRCRAQTTENNCTTMLIRGVPCAWCSGTEKCVL
ncbi:Egg protein, partial [Schistosoma japonicum]